MRSGFSSINIVPNDRKPWALSLARSLEKFLRNRGFRVSGSGARTTLCIGGDGTIFHFFYKNALSGAVLGIGSKTSSVCQFRHETLNMKSLLSVLRSGRTENRLTLLAEAGGAKYRSINDIVVHTHDYRVITVTLKAGKKSFVFEGDGLIISTPTGSSAYAYSAGGKKMHRNARKIQLVPICPYRRTLKPMVLGEGAEISVVSDRTADLILDGIYIRRLLAGETLSVRKGKDLAFIIQ